MSLAEARPSSPAAAWWWSLDRTALLFIVILLIIGGILSMTAGPAAAARLEVDDPFYFPIRHGVHATLAGAVMLALSRLDVVAARRFASILLAVSVVALALTLAAGLNVKGASRWLGVGPVAFQPIEFVKPAFLVTAAWLLSEGRRPGGPPGTTLSLAGLAALVLLLLLQPDVGQAVLVCGVFAMLLFLAGGAWRVLGGLVAAGVVAAGLVFVSLSHVRIRVLSFLGGDEGDRYQLDHALEAVRRGGFFGVGPGEGQVVARLPDAHTDFVFVAAAEEFGAVFCVATIAVFALLTMRVLRRASGLLDPMARLAASGLVVLIALQALINVGVNLGVVPPKGMTLPFISYGGSSLVGMGVTAGLILSFTRRRPGAYAA